MQPNALLDVPHHERRIFKRHFLNSVHCEMSFAVELDRLLAARDALAAGLQGVGFRYVRDLQRSTVAFEADASGAAPPRLQSSSVASGLAFANDNPHREMHISTGGLVSSDLAYTSFEEFTARLLTAIELVKSHVGDVVVRKIGLRKVNAIRIDTAKDPAEAVAPFNTRLFGFARAGAISPAAFKASQELLLLERDGSVCNLRTGLAATGTPNSYDVQLDFDVQQKVQPSNSIDSELASMNAFIYDIFRWSITDEFITVLEA